MGFDPNSIPDGQCAEGHLDAVPIYEILLSVKKTGATGRLTIEDAAGENHMFFMRGQPVGVELSDALHPLGQLLLELGRIDGATFVKAQRLIAEGQRLPGQVFKELGVLDDDKLKEVLGIQARRKAEAFCRHGGRPFTFCRGLTFLAGFNATPLDIHAVVFLALKQQMGPKSREEWLEEVKGHEVRSLPEGEMPLPAALEVFGFGPPEERFLGRLMAGFEPVERLAETGTLPPDEMAVLLRFLQLLGRLELRKLKQEPAEAPALDGNTEDNVFSRAAPAEAIEPSPRAPGPDPEHTKSRALASDIHDVPTELPEARAPRAAPRPLEPEPRPVAQRPAGTPKRVESLLSKGSSPKEVGRIRFPSESTLKEEPRPKKKRLRRAVPEPSVGTVAVSSTKKEKTEITPLPSILVDLDDDAGK